jgi:hypothetical protein
MLIAGMVMGTMVTFGFCLIYGRLPPWVKEFAKKHPIATEILLTCGFYAIMGMSLTAHMTVAVMVLEMQGLFHIARNPEKFLWLNAMRDKARESIRGLTSKLDQINENWKREHANELQEVKHVA